MEMDYYNYPDMDNLEVGAEEVVNSSSTMTTLSGQRVPKKARKSTVSESESYSTYCDDVGVLSPAASVMSPAPSVVGSVDLSTDAVIKEIEQYMGLESENIVVKKLRGIIPKMKMVTCLPLEDWHGKEKVKYLWESIPYDWPTDVPHIDPNNGIKKPASHDINAPYQHHKPKKDELVKMFVHLKDRYRKMFSNPVEDGKSEMTLQQECKLGISESDLQRHDLQGQCTQVSEPEMEQSVPVHVPVEENSRVSALVERVGKQMNEVEGALYHHPQYWAALLKLYNDIFKVPDRGMGQVEELSNFVDACHEFMAFLDKILLGITYTDQKFNTQCEELSTKYQQPSKLAVKQETYAYWRDSLGPMAPQEQMQVYSLTTELHLKPVEELKARKMDEMLFGEHHKNMDLSVEETKALLQKLQSPVPTELLHSPQVTTDPTELGIQLVNPESVTGCVTELLMSQNMQTRKISSVEEDPNKLEVPEKLTKYFHGDIQPQKLPAFNDLNHSYTTSGSFETETPKECNLVDDVLGLENEFNFQANFLLQHDLGEQSSLLKSDPYFGTRSADDPLLLGQPAQSTIDLNQYFNMSYPLNQEQLNAPTSPNETSGNGSPVVPDFTNLLGDTDAMDFE